MRLSTCIKNFRISRSLSTARMSSSNSKKVIKIDVCVDTVCPWCYVGKKNMEKAIASSNDRYDFEIKWHPYVLDPNSPKQGIGKDKYYLNRYGPRSVQMESRMAQIFKGLGMDYDTTGLIGNTLDSHRLIYFAGTQGFDKQDKLVEELFSGYFTQGRFIGDREFLVECAKKVGVEGAAEFLEDPNNGLKEVKEDLKQYSGQVGGVPHYTINGKHQLSGGQPPESFLRAFQAAAK